MVQPIAPIAPAIATPPVQPVQNPAQTAPTNTGNASFISAFEQAATLQDEEDILNIGDASTTDISGSDNSVLDGTILANLSPQALTILSEANTNISTNADGNLTPVQLEEIATLQSDAQMLNLTGDETFNNDIALLGDNINLSTQAVNILNGIDPGAGIGVVNTLTTAQLQQLAGIITPFINAPLTQTTLTQLQNALTAAGFNPSQLSLQTIFLSMNFVAELAPIVPADAEQQALNDEIITENTTALLDA